MIHGTYTANSSSIFILNWAARVRNGLKCNYPSTNMKGKCNLCNSPESESCRPRVVVIGVIRSIGGGGGGGGGGHEEGLQDGRWRLCNRQRHKGASIHDVRTERVGDNM